MQLDVPSPRKTSWRRCAGKLAWFLCQGNSPATAWWLSRHDAVRHGNYRGISRATLEAAWKADPSWADLVPDQGRIASRALQIDFLGDDLFSRGYATWRALHHLGWRFAREEGHLEARRDGLVLRLSTDEEQDMIKEIFLAGCYDLQLPGTWQVVDIGANVGMAALFFASRSWVRRVFSFEPFAPTAECFRFNAGRNPKLADKITLRQTALGDAAGTQSVDYHSELRGSMSLVGLGAWRHSSQSNPVQKVAITIEQASVALGPVFAELGPDRLLAKIDCEGSEYAIIPELHSSGMLARFSALVIEWHGRGPDELVKVLLQSGFAVGVHPLSPDQTTLGLIYATRLSAPPTSS